MAHESSAMADIIFLLLIFFLLSSSFVMQVGTKVSLPRESRPSPLDPKHMVITLEKSGEMFLDTERVTLTELEGRLGEALAEDPERAVVVRGDEAISLGVTVEVLDLAKRMGATRVAIATRPRTATG
jgi:biopolymer transport protein ExbD